jgi:hypothetical protein
MAFTTPGNRLFLGSKVPAGRGRLVYLPDKQIKEKKENTGKKDNDKRKMA